jgi:hypothetical protein
VKPVQALPEGYRLTATLDLSKDRWALVGLNLAGLALFAVCGWLFAGIFRVLRAEFSLSAYYPNFFVNVVTLLVASGLVIILHELVHGLFFWLYLRERPEFGFRGTYAYAAAPNWYIPRGRFVVIGLAPLVLITLAGLAAVMVFPPGSLPLLWFAVVLNAAGAVGDIFIVSWLYFQPPTVLVKDQGDRFSMFLPS